VIKMKIALAQMEVLPGRPRKNLETMLEMIGHAKAENADLIAFPEMCLGGYLVGDKWLDDGYCNNLMDFNEELRKASDGIAIAYGNIFVDKGQNKDGRSRKYNAAYVYQNGQLAERLDDAGLLPKGVEPKTLLPNYRFFDDERYFFSLEDIAKDYGRSLEELAKPFMIEVDGKKVPIGFEICEDLWCADYRRNGQPENITKTLIDNGAQMIVNISASPWTYGKNNARDRRIKFLKEQSGEGFVPFLYVNCTGVQNNGKNIITFDGGSTAYNNEGLPVKLSRQAYLEELIIVEEKDFENPVQRQERPKIEQKYQAIIAGIRHAKEMIGAANQPNYVIGLSGGVDSSVVAALLVQAVGREKVLGINMPTKYNSGKTRGAAAHVAEELGIAYHEIPIEDLVTLNQKAIDAIDADGSGRALSEFNMENVQAKIRGASILSNIAAKYNALFTNNGNKLEVALGYATLYGDVGGAFAPIGDLTKAEVFDLARHINQEVYGREVIPEILLPDELYRFGEGKIKPGPELKAGQINPTRFGYHDALIEAMTDYNKKSPEDIMKWYLEGSLEEKLGIKPELVRRWGIDNPAEFVKDLEWFTGLMQRNVFKRIQSPPIIVTSKSAYGFDIRESIMPDEPTIRYSALKEKVLAMEKYVTEAGACQ
jgi:NAD+ synthase (glutamine-hydrolysing)